MKPYRTIDDVLSDRRKGEKLSEVVENILHSPYVLSEIETPFDLIGEINRGDYLDMTTRGWGSLPVELQMRYANAYQVWYAYHSGHPNIEGMFELVPRTEIKMRLIPPGRFRIGSPKGEVGRYPSERQRMVHIKKAFWCGESEITQEEWLAVTDADPSHFKGALRPVTNVNSSWCNTFCERVGMRLPTEEEWEYACRAGTTTVYNSGNDILTLHKYGVCDQLYFDGPKNVKSKKPNAWGLYDMHGSVWEWTNSTYFETSLRRIVRGGSWFSPVELCRSAMRLGDDPWTSENNYGLRVCRDV